MPRLTLTTIRVELTYTLHDLCVLFMYLLLHRRWRAIGGHLRSISAGACDVVWGISFDGTPLAYNGGFGGGVFVQSELTIAIHFQNQTSILNLGYARIIMWWCNARACDAAVSVALVLFVTCGAV